jgi:hypothetical protein
LEKRKSTQIQFGILVRKQPTLHTFVYYLKFLRIVVKRVQMCLTKIMQIFKTTKAGERVDSMFNNRKLVKYVMLIIRDTMKSLREIN